MRDARPELTEKELKPQALQIPFRARALSSARAAFVLANLRHFSVAHEPRSYACRSYASRPRATDGGPRSSASIAACRRALLFAAD